MTVVAPQNPYLDRLESFVAGRQGQEPAWLTSHRQAAATRVRLLGLPTTRDEEWRFTPIAPILEIPFAAAEETGARPSAARIDPDAIREMGGHLLVFVNGRFAADLSTRRALPAGVLVTNLAAALETHGDMIGKYFARGATYDRQAFTALNTALAADGAVVHLPANADLDEPVHVLYFSTGSSPFATHPRTLILADAHSRGRVVESYAGSTGDIYFTNAVTEIVAAEGSHLEHYRVQRESLAAYHVSTTHVHLRRSAVFAQQNFTLGAALARNDVSARLDAEGIECTLNGLYLADGTRLADNHTSIDHAKPHCNSHEVYKGMLDGRARGVFNGKIFVRQDAQKTDAKQTNQVLLLSDDATINTKPQLEIFADDVKCTHGATIGQIDAEAMFYLRARGIGEQEARAILVHAFAREIIDRVAIEPLRESLEETLLGYLRNAHVQT